MTHPLAGKPADPALLADIPALLAAYAARRPNPALAAERVAFGTSGHRGSALTGSFNEAHILAITQAICEYRAAEGIRGPLFLGRDTHALSGPAGQSVLGVLAANAVETRLQRDDGYAPTPAISRAILAHNADPARARADGIVVTPSHNPPEDGGIKYNPPHGGPADTDVTRRIESRANALLAEGNRRVRPLGHAEALAAPTTREEDLAGAYIESLDAVIDMAAIRRAGIRIGVHPLGGAAVHYWARIADRWGLDITVVDETVDPAFGFMPLDHDGRIRMDCSSRFAMAGLVALKDRFDIAWGNDADVDRHGIVTPAAGLMNPNHYLAVAIDYLLTHRPGWRAEAAIGKTLVSSALIDRVVAAQGRRLLEVPVGFKWFSAGLLDGSLCFGGEESAGAAFVCRDGSAWTTDKDGILLGLLAAEIRAVTGTDPGVIYRGLVTRHGEPRYTRIDAAITPAQKSAFAALVPQQLGLEALAGEAVEAVLTQAPGNGAAIGGLKVCSRSGWFAARPSGTEPIYKIYAESFVDEAHLGRIVAEARAIVEALG